jgi:hypothetical protein
MSESVLESRKARAQAWFETLRHDICAALEALETALPARRSLIARQGDSSVRRGLAPITTANRRAHSQAAIQAREPLTPGRAAAA